MRVHVLSLACLVLNTLGISALDRGAEDRKADTVLSPHGNIQDPHPRMMRSETKPGRAEHTIKEFSDKEFRVNEQGVVEHSELELGWMQSRSGKQLSPGEWDRFHEDIVRMVQQQAERPRKDSRKAKQEDASRADKVAKGLAAAPRLGGSSLVEARQTPVQGNGTEAVSSTAPHFSLPRTWLGQETVQPPANCQVAIGVDAGFSDYGTISHPCTACESKLTEENAQPDLWSRKLFQPELKDCQALEVSNYVKIEKISELRKSDNVKNQDIGYVYNYAYNISATKSGTMDIPPFGAKVGFLAYQSHGKSTVGGKLVVFIEDTEPPQDINRCKGCTPGRRYALAGDAKSGENFFCGRLCTHDKRKYPWDGHACPCGFKDALACGVYIELEDDMMIEFRFQKQADGVMATLEDTESTNSVSQGSFAGDQQAGLGATSAKSDVTMMGQAWEAKAIFPVAGTSQKREIVIGRVVLQGNSPDEGIKDMVENVEHFGHLECDLMYTSVVTSGPNIIRPAGVHSLVSASIDSPEVTSTSCELQRVTALAGGVMRFEHGPGLWPATGGQSDVTAYTCQQQGSNTGDTCPSNAATAPAQ